MKVEQFIGQIMQALEEASESQEKDKPKFKENFDVDKASDEELHEQLFAIWQKDNTLDAAREIYKKNPLVAAYIHCMNQHVNRHEKQIRQLRRKLTCKA